MEPTKDMRLLMACLIHDNGGVLRYHRSTLAKLPDDAEIVVMESLDKSTIELRLKFPGQTEEPFTIEHCFTDATLEQLQRCGIEIKRSGDAG